MQDHPPSTMLIRSVMRRELGFTVRDHRLWNGQYYDTQVCLDFYDPRQMTWFVVRYGEFL